MKKSMEGDAVPLHYKIATGKVAGFKSGGTVKHVPASTKHVPSNAKHVIVTSKKCGGMVKGRK